MRSNAELYFGGTRKIHVDDLQSSFGALTGQSCLLPFIELAHSIEEVHVGIAFLDDNTTKVTMKAKPNNKT